MVIGISNLLDDGTLTRLGLEVFPEQRMLLAERPELRMQLAANPVFGVGRPAFVWRKGASKHQAEFHRATHYERTVARGRTERSETACGNQRR